MKRWLCLFFLCVGIVSLLLIPGHQASLNQHPHARDRSVVRSGEFVSTLFGVLIATSPALTRSRADPSESSETRFALLTADDASPPWLDYRGPPGVCGRPWVSCRGAGQAGSSQQREKSTLRTRNYCRSRYQIKRVSFATAFS